MRRAWPAILWAVIITVTSSTVIKSRAFTHAVATHTPIHITETGFARFWNQWWWIFVKGYHMLEFALLALLIERAVPRRYDWVLILTLIAAGLDEYHQTFIPERGGRVTDVIIDMAGATLAILIIARYRSASPGLARKSRATAKGKNGGSV
jgi:hypothetical protein